LKSFRLQLARKLFERGLWKLGVLMLRDGDLLFVESGATLVFRHNGRLETRKGTRVG
jgi:hypothetical protein